MAPTPGSTLVEEKRALRRLMGERRGRLSAEERATYAQAAVQRLLALPQVVAGRSRSGGTSGDPPVCLTGYVAIRGEVDPAAVLEAARTSGMLVALPRITTMWPPRIRFHRTDTAADLGPGPYGLTEPLPSCPEVPVETVDLMIVPGLAFDAEGRRLGQGGGYYDDAGRRMREAKRGGLMVGFAFDFQVIEHCPADAEDVAVDLVVTDQRVLTVQVPGAGA
jgi:5-formyltetrahydrofolate cyclo-ligase